MRKVSLLANIMFCIGIMFSSCVKEENLAADIAGTYKGTNYFSKATETNALVVITEIDNNHVSVQYDAATKELAYAGSEAKVTKEGNVYKFEGATAIETISGTVEGTTLNLVVLVQGVEMANIIAEKE